MYDYDKFVRTGLIPPATGTFLYIEAREIPARKGMKRTYESLSAEERERLDRALLDENAIPIKDLADRFSLHPKRLHDRLKQLGYTTRRTCKETGTQERVLNRLKRSNHITTPIEV